MINVLKASIKKVLIDENIDEYRFIFAVTKIRKILEGSSKTIQNKYKFLYFYCNWLLHTKLDRKNSTDIVIDRILALNDINDATTRFIFHEDFFEELKDFCRENCQFEYNDKLSKKIGEIISKSLTNVPLIITTEKKYKYELKYENGHYYRITEIM